MHLRECFSFMRWSTFIWLGIKWENLVIWIVFLFKYSSALFVSTPKRINVKRWEPIKNGIKTQVRQLYEVLTSLEYKVWLDERELNAGSSPLTAELATAIKNSKVILSCIPTDYCKSYVYASDKKKEFKLSPFYSQLSCLMSFAFI